MIKSSWTIFKSSCRMRWSRPRINWLMWRRCWLIIARIQFSKINKHHWCKSVHWRLITIQIWIGCTRLAAITAWWGWIQLLIQMIITSLLFSRIKDTIQLCTDCHGTNFKQIYWQLALKIHLWRFIRWRNQNQFTITIWTRQWFSFNGLHQFQQF